MLVRPAGLDDVDTLVSLGQRMHAEGAYGFLPYDQAKVRRRVTGYVTERVDACLLVAEHAGTLTGMLGGYLEEYFFCDERVASDVFVYVDPPYRGTTAAVKLVDAFCAWAAAHGAREVCLGISSGVRTPQVEKFYEKLGFVRAGSIYKRRA